MAYALGHLSELVHRKGFRIVKANCTFVHLDENRHGSTKLSPSHTCLPSDRKGDGVVWGLAGACILLMHVHCQAGDHICVSHSDCALVLLN